MGTTADTLAILFSIVLIAWIFIELWRNRKKGEPPRKKELKKNHADLRTVPQVP